MSASFGSGLAQRLLQFALLRAAAMLVPAGQRGDWFSEWRGELWHVETSEPHGRA